MPWPSFSLTPPLSLFPQREDLSDFRAAVLRLLQSQAGLSSVQVARLQPPGALQSESLLNSSPRTHNLASLSWAESAQLGTQSQAEGVALAASEHSQSFRLYLTAFIEQKEPGPQNQWVSEFLGAVSSNPDTLPSLL